MMNEMWNDNPLDPWTEEENHLSKMGVVSFGKGGGGGQPAHTTQTTTSEYPTELKPFIKDIFGKAKGIEEAKTSAGYQAYPAPRIAGFTPDQQAAFTGIREAQGLSTPFYGGATSLVQRGTRDFTPALAQQYMSPYAQNVIDIEQRELARRGDVERQRIGAGAAGAGGFGGSRHAILEAEQARQQGQQASDIQTKGLQSAFQSAQQAIAQQRQADLAGAQQMASLGAAVPGQRFKELGALAGLGAAQQTQDQRALDLGYRQFLEEQAFPMKTLQDYSSVLRGFPLPASQTIDKIAYSPVAPLSSQLLGAGVGLTGLGGMAGMFGAGGGHVAKLQQGGLASMYAPSNRVRFGKTNYQDPSADVVEYLLSSKVDEDKPFGRLESEGSYDQGKPYTALYRWWNPWWQQEAKNEGKMTEDGIPITNLDMSLTPESRTEIKEALRFNIDKSTGKPWTIERIRDLGVEDLWIEVRKEEQAKKDLKYAKSKEGKEEAKLAKEEKELKDKERVKKWQDELDAKDAKRIADKERIAKWAPWLAGATEIAESETPLKAFLKAGETYGKSELSIDAAKDAETARRAGISAAAIDSAETLSKVYKNLSGTDRLVAVTTLRSSTLNTPEQNAIYDAEIAELLENTSDRDLELIRGQIRGRIDPNLITRLVEKAQPVAGEKVVEALEEVSNKTGGRVKLNKGGTPPIRSFDFVERDGKIIATPI